MTGIILIVGIRNARYDQPEVCHRCGYDLRGSGDRCSECGEPLSRQVLMRRRVLATLEQFTQNAENIHRDGF